MKNNNPIVRLFFARMKPEFFQLSEEERRQFMIRDRANLDALGMKAISMVDCTRRDEEWDYIGVESWPSMEAIEERERFERKSSGFPGMLTIRSTWGLSSPSRMMASHEGLYRWNIRQTRPVHGSALPGQ